VPPRSLYEISTKVVRAAIEVTRDPTLAASLIDTLRPYEHLTKPRVALPPTWVLSHLSRAPLASFSVEHCDDPRTLRHVAKTERRVSVLRALLKNPHLPKSTRAKIREHVKDTYPASHLLVILADLPAPATPFAIARAYAATLPKDRIHRNLAFAHLADALLAHREKHQPSPEELGTVLCMLATKGATQAVEDYVLYYYGLFGAPTSHVPSARTPSPWRGATVAPANLLNLLTARDRKNILERLLLICDSSPDLLPATPFAPDMARLMRTHIKPRESVPFPQPSLHKWLTTDAVDVLLSTKAWHEFLAAQQMTKDQAHKFLSSHGPPSNDETSELFYQARRTYQLRAEKPPHHVYVRQETSSIHTWPATRLEPLLDVTVNHASRVASHITNFEGDWPALLLLASHLQPGDPLVPRILELVHADHLPHLILGGVRLRDGSSAYPTAEDLPGILKEIDQDPPEAWPRYLHGVPSDAYLGILATCTSATPYFLENETATKYLARLLLKITTNIPQYSELVGATASHTSIHQLCMTIATLERAKDTT
jgi:hypothetical protein